MSLLLDALQRASLEKEKLAEARASADKPSPPAKLAPSETNSPLTIDFEPSGPVADSSGRSEQPQTSHNSFAEPNYSLSVAEESPLVELVVEQVVESATHTHELVLDPVKQSMTVEDPAIGNSPVLNTEANLSIRDAAVVSQNSLRQNGKQDSEPNVDRVAPSIAPHAAVDRAEPAQVATQKHPSPVASPQVAREILGATAKTSSAGPNRRLIILGVVAFLFVAANAAFFLGFLDSLLGLSSPGLGPVANIGPAATLPVPIEGPAVASDDRKSGEPPASTEIKTEPVAVAASSVPIANPLQPPNTSADTVLPSTQREKERLDSDDVRASKPARRAIRANTAQPVFIAKPAAASVLDTAYAALTDGRFNEAVDVYNMVLAKNPAERDALLGLAYIAQREGRREEARGLYQRVLRLQPDHPGASAGLLTLAAEGDLQLTASRARDMAERNPESAVAQSTLAGFLVKEGRIAEAQQAYFKALALEPDNALHAYNLAVALDRLHKYGPAQAYYQRALGLAEKSGNGEKSSFPSKEAIQRLEQLRARE